MRNRKVRLFLKNLIKKKKMVKAYFLTNDNLYSILLRHISLAMIIFSQLLRAKGEKKFGL